MAIRRCPYCKAIIDEDSEYCSNCGTQLLFPEDEFIEEEIPREKVVDEEPAQKPRRARKKATRKRKKVEIEKEEKEQAEFVEEDESLQASESIEEEKEERESSAELDLKQQETPEEKEEPWPKEEELEEKEEKEEGLDFWPKEKEMEEPPSPAEEKPAEEIEEKKWPEAPSEEREKPQKELTFKTEELEKIVDPAEKEKEEIERFLQSIKKEREESEPQEEIISSPLETEEKSGETEEELPPWAEKIKKSEVEEALFFDEEEKRQEPSEKVQEPETEDREPPLGRTSDYDSGIGLPEESGEKELPFMAERLEEEEGGKLKSPSKFVLWLKSKAFDLLFIGIIWIIGLWIASRVMEVSLFKLISASAVPVVIFYFIMLIVYLALFLLFLGETLGEHLFYQE